MDKQSEIRDSRAKDWFYLDNELLEVFGGKGKDDKGIGIHAMGVYMVLAKHANNDTQQCKPSYQTIATILGVARNTVITAIKTLEKAGVISIEQRTTREDKKVFTTNIYTLMKIKAAKPIPADELPSSQDALPSARGGLGVVQEMVYPSAPEGRELDLSDKTNLNKTNTTPLPPKEKPAANRMVVDEKFLMRKKLQKLLPANQQLGISPAMSERFHEITDSNPLEWCQAAFDICADGNHSIAYLIGILNHWQSHGFKCACHNPKAASPGPIPFNRPPDRKQQPQLTAFGTPFADTDNLPWYPKDGVYGKDFIFTAKQA